MITLGESPMPYIKKKIDRNQVMITSFDSFVESERIARVIDYFVDHIDLIEMGFQRTEANARGRGCYPPSNLIGESQMCMSACPLGSLLAEIIIKYIGV